MSRAIEETDRRRAKQEAHNAATGTVPRAATPAAGALSTATTAKAGHPRCQAPPPSSGEDLVLAMCAGDPRASSEATEEDAPSGAEWSALLLASGAAEAEAMAYEAAEAMEAAAEAGRFDEAAAWRDRRDAARGRHANQGP